MRSVLIAGVLLLAACGGHRTPRSSCTLRTGATATPRTGEHSLSVRSSCALRATPRVRLLGLRGRRLRFTYVFEGGPKGAHTILLDKYRCDIRYRDLGRTVVLADARLDVGRSLMDWCPAQAASTVVHVYLGGRHARPTWRSVFRDAYDGRLDRVWPCGALRSAIAHLPTGRIYSSLPGQLARAAAPACDAALADIPRGSPRFAVEEALGAASGGGPRCRVWRWAPAAGSIDGARVCFVDGRATVIQSAVHG